jgi:hypothetical protein
MNWCRCSRSVVFQKQQSKQAKHSLIKWKSCSGVGLRCAQFAPMSSHIVILYAYLVTTDLIEFHFNLTPTLPQRLPPALTLTLSYVNLTRIHRIQQNQRGHHTSSVCTMTKAARCSSNRGEFVEWQCDIVANYWHSN